MSSAVAVTGTSYETLAYMTLVLSTVVTGRTKFQIQGRWISDPGSKTMFVKRTLDPADCEVYVRIQP